MLDATIEGWIVSTQNLLLFMSRYVIPVMKKFMPKLLWHYLRKKIGGTLLLITRRDLKKHIEKKDAVYIFLRKSTEEVWFKREETWYTLKACLYIDLRCRDDRNNDIDNELI